MICTPACWTPVPCPACGRPLPPRGRSIPLGASPGRCCEEAAGSSRINSRHLWHEHDDDRHYIDPEGWAAHVAACDSCRDESCA